MREATLVITDSDEHVVRELHFSYPKGAPSDERHRVRLKSGSYVVGGRITGDGFTERHPSRPLTVEDAGVYPVDLSGGATL